jgi:molybdopterin-containing oxidoreductase family iron-sulfur binding subunit
MPPVRPPPSGQWRGLDHLARDPQFVARASAEFPSLSRALAEPRDRRGVLRLMAAGLALAGLGGCDDGAPEGVLIPPVLPPRDAVSAGNRMYATASVLGGYGTGILVRHVNGRPIKVEGNPRHPSSLGGTSAIDQATILGFYDPDRSRSLIRDGEPQAWSALLTALAGQRDALAQSRGKGFRILTGSVTSPTLARQIADLRRLYPGLRWHRWEPVSRDAVRAGAILAYGQPVEVVPKLDAADVIVAIDSDLLDSAPGHLASARAFAARRNPVRTETMSRVHALEPTPTLIGVAADHRHVVRPSDLTRIVPALAAALGNAVPGNAPPGNVGLGTKPPGNTPLGNTPLGNTPLGNMAPGTPPAEIARNVPGGMPPWFGSLVADLRAAHGRAFIHAGPTQPAEIHALVHAMNEALGGRNATYALIDPVEVDPVDQATSLRELMADMQAGRVTSLLIIDSNPVFTAPGFADALPRVPFSMTLAVGASETAGKTHWALPQRHPFEDWSDVRAFDGTVTILQPQAQPLFGGISPYDLLALFAGPSEIDSRDAVRQTLKLSDDQWHDALAAGVVANSQAAVSAVALQPPAARPGQTPAAQTQPGQTPPASAQPGRSPATPAQPGQTQPASAQPAAAPPEPQAAGSETVTLLFRPDPHLWDGRFANNAWLQELPRPLTKLTWDNPLLVSPAIAERLHLVNGDRVTVAAGNTSLVLPAWVMPGQAADCAVALLGFGRQDVGMVGHGVGYDVYPLTGTEGPVSLRKAEGREQLACTEHHDPMFSDAGEFVRHGTLAAFKANPAFLGHQPANPELYNRKPPGPAAWGMSIDLNACIGCNACVVACMAENNIPVVGRQQVIHEREMHWLRIDRYYEGTPETPDMLFQPVLCQHCETAPCEIVCPVGATVHDSEGLNVMVYNRCVGTRFCSNNCPYKVRRFNYYDFAQEEHRPAIARNPDVTVRARGVMEKCTFCLQRIAAARIDADVENRPVGADEVKTACQAACPTQAFSFGNMAEGGAVMDRKKSPLSYALLEDQDTRPRVTYEARITNPGQDAGA